MEHKKMTPEQWLAIKNCDKNYDGQFFYALKSTKTICKPSCTARTPNPKNVEIFFSVMDGFAAGYHPCQRCRVDRPDWQGAKYDLVAHIQTYIQNHYAENLSAQRLSQILFRDPAYLQRTFKQITGLTVIEYLHQIRIASAQQFLQETACPLTTISRLVGYQSPSHFSRCFKKLVGYPPSQFRKEGQLDKPKNPQSKEPS